MLELPRAIHARSQEPAAVWRTITNCSAGSWDRELVSKIDVILQGAGFPRDAVLLDLGAGFGNPALGLAELRYRLTAIDKDRDMVSSLRLASGAARLKLLEADWRTVLASFERDVFDCVLVLGNALSYQDSWPSDVPNAGPWQDSLGTTLAELSRIVKPGGLLLGEWSFEPPGTGVETYARQYRHANGNSTWLVRCDHQTRIRAIDTFVSDPTDEKGRITSYARYVGYLFSEQEMVSVTERNGWIWTRASHSLRRPFTTVAAVNGK